jgi:single-strand DNA-binding protein
MLNQMVVVGRLVRDPELRETENGKKVSNITLAVPRSYKNSDGEYDTDFLDITLWNNIAENSVEYVTKGDLLGVKGRISSKSVEIDGISKNEIVLVAEKVTYLSNKKERDIDDSLEKDKDI